MNTKGMRLLCLLLFGAALFGTSVVGVAVMSVDIGTEWMKVAVVSPGVPMEIALNPESKRKTSVAVSFQNGERKFGSDAMSVCVKNPGKCYVYLLDLLGKPLDHPLVVAYQKRFPHYKLESTDRGTIQFRIDEETAYSVEELVGMVLNHAKLQAEDFTQQKIKDAVITVPVYFNQAERLALVAAGTLAGINVLQLMNEPTAVALNYGMFRRKEINGTVRNIMFYDMGAQDTTVSIVGFQIVKIKERGFAETHPQAQVLGIGYDRTLGGGEIKFRIREYLADEFNAMKKTKTDVRTVPRAMGKLLKEAERVKLILSANSECFAQVENVMEDIDFKVPMNREKIEELCTDLWDRVTKPIDDALSSAGMALENIDQIIMMGGGSRVPKVQELLTKHLSRELGKNMNTDESAAMGAVYKAADLSSGFKVKKFITKDAVIFPIDVDFERELDPSEVSDGKSSKKIRRTLFSRMNPYPQKKIMTFNKHVKDFTFYVNYDDVAYLGEKEVAYLGVHNVTSVLVKGVAEALDKNKGDTIETKGVKAHFVLDESGILSVSGVESVFEKTISVEEQEKEEKEKEDTWSKLGETFSQLFSKQPGADGTAPEEGGAPNADTPDADKAKETEDKKDGEGAKSTSDGKPASDKKEKEAKDKKEKKKEPKKPRQETIKEELSTEEERLDIQTLGGESFETSRARLEALDKADRDRFEREGALNDLQSFVFDLQDKMYQEEYEAASTSEEREKITGECSTISDWLDEEAGPNTDIKEFKDRMKTLKDLSSAIFARAREHNERPEMLQSLESAITSSRQFLEKSANLTGDEGLFKEKELDALKKKLDEVTKWKEEKLAEQADTPLHEMPKLTVSMIGQKISDIDSEVKFLVQKAKMVKAEKERARRLKEAEEKKAKEEAEKEAKKAAKKAEKEAKEGDKTKDDIETESSADAPSDPVVEDTPSETGDQQPETDDKQPETVGDDQTETVGDESESVSTGGEEEDTDSDSTDQSSSQHSEL